MSAATAQTANETTSTLASEGVGLGAGRTASVPVRAKSWGRERPVLTREERSTIDAGEGEIEFEKLGGATLSMQPSATGDQWTSATVLSVEPETVKCEVVAGKLSWEVSLPRVFFGDRVGFGTPVRLGIRDVNGYRTPVVELDTRNLAADPELENLKQKLLAL